MFVPKAVFVDKELLQNGVCSGGDENKAFFQMFPGSEAWLWAASGGIEPGYPCYLIYCFCPACKPDGK